MEPAFDGPHATAAPEGGKGRGTCGDPTEMPRGGLHTIAMCHIRTHSPRQCNPEFTERSADPFPRRAGEPENHRRPPQHHERREARPDSGEAPVEGERQPDQRQKSDERATPASRSAGTPRRPRRAAHRRARTRCRAIGIMPTKNHHGDRRACSTVGVGGEQLRDHRVARREDARRSRREHRRPHRHPPRQPPAPLQCPPRPARRRRASAPRSPTSPAPAPRSSTAAAPSGARATAAAPNRAATARRRDEAHLE